jgi:hypothetical protein
LKFKILAAGFLFTILALAILKTKLKTFNKNRGLCL